MTGSERLSDAEVRLVLGALTAYRDHLKSAPGLAKVAGRSVTVIESLLAERRALREALAEVLSTTEAGWRDPTHVVAERPAFVRARALLAPRKEEEEEEEGR